MPTTRIEIEQIEGTRWVAEVELGGLSARREVCKATSFSELIKQIENAYYERHPEEEPIQFITGSQLELSAESGQGMGREAKSIETIEDDEDIEQESFNLIKEVPLPSAPQKPAFNLGGIGDAAN